MRPGARGAGHRVQSLQTEQLTDQRLCPWSPTWVPESTLCCGLCVTEAPTFGRFPGAFSSLSEIPAMEGLKGVRQGLKRVKGRKQAGNLSVRRARMTIKEKTLV